SDIQNSQQEFIFYNSEDGTLKVQVIVDVVTETLWATQKAMSELFGVTPQNITIHLKNIFQSGELQEESVCKENLQTARDGKTYMTKFYNLDAIISVGYRVNSQRATRFRQWATKVLKEYLVKGFALDDERLKAGGNIFGKEHFDELLERVQEIRASERLFYQKLTDMLMVSEDYDPAAREVRDIFAFLQNKLEFTVIGNTSAEIIVARVNAHKPNCGLLSWKDRAKGGKIQYSDTTIAKNYMTHDELSELTTLVNLCLDSAEIKIKRQEHIKMVDWVEMFNAQLRVHGYEILSGKGKVSAEQAKQTAKEQWQQFRPIQDAKFKSDFDKLVEASQKKKP
ncbi:MAG: virulence RhuM family protein, partial [Synergistaceae bacterium]|nr:virulence RhuM family protein [Synergistaceae bacterium]